MRFIKRLIKSLATNNSSQGTPWGGERGSREDLASEKEMQRGSEDRSLEPATREHRGGELCSGENRGLGVSLGSQIEEESIRRIPQERGFLSALERALKCGRLGQEGCSLGMRGGETRTGKRGGTGSPAIPQTEHKWEGSSRAGQTWETHVAI